MTAKHYLQIHWCSSRLPIAVQVLSITASKLPLLSFLADRNASGRRSSSRLLRVWPSSCMKRGRAYLHNDASNAAAEQRDDVSCYKHSLAVIGDGRARNNFAL